MQLLLERGADMDNDLGVQRCPLHSFFGFVLHHASHYGRAEVVHLILQHNGDVNARNRINNLKTPPTPGFEQRTFGSCQASPESWN